MEIHILTWASAADQENDPCLTQATASDQEEEVNAITELTASDHEEVAILREHLAKY